MSQTPACERLRKFFRRVDRTDWRNAAVAGVLVGMLPVIGFALALFVLDRPILNDPQAALLFGAMVLLAGAMVGATDAAITLIFSVFIRHWPNAMRHLVDEYEDFAQQVGGELVVSQPPRLFGFFGSTPRQVAFTYHDADVLLEIVTKRQGENTYVYIDLMFQSAKLGDFTCHLYSSGMISRLGKFFAL